MGRTFRETLAASERHPVPTTCVFGYGQRTLVEVRVRREHDGTFKVLDEIFDDAGDDAVTEASAVLDRERRLHQLAEKLALRALASHLAAGALGVECVRNQRRAVFFLLRFNGDEIELRVGRRDYEAEINVVNGAAGGDARLSIDQLRQFVLRYPFFFTSSTSI